MKNLLEEGDVVHIKNVKKEKSLPKKFRYYLFWGIFFVFYMFFAISLTIEDLGLFWAVGVSFMVVVISIIVVLILLKIISHAYKKHSEFLKTIAPNEKFAVFKNTETTEFIFLKLFSNTIFIHFVFLILLSVILITKLPSWVIGVWALMYYIRLLLKPTHETGEYFIFNPETGIFESPKISFRIEDVLFLNTKYRKSGNIWIFIFRTHTQIFKLSLERISRDGSEFSLSEKYKIPKYPRSFIEKLGILIFCIIILFFVFLSFLPKYEANEIITSIINKIVVFFQFFL